MTKDEILDYVTKTPYNTNRAVLSGMLDSISESGETTPTQELLLLSYSENVNQVMIDFYEPAKQYGGKCHIAAVEDGNKITIECTDFTTPDGVPLPQEVISYMKEIIPSVFESTVYQAFLDMILENSFVHVPIVYIVS